MAECNDFSETLENLVTCVICCDVLTNPKTLPCLHTLCLKCLQDWNKTCKKNRRRFTCPLVKHQSMYQKKMSSVFQLPSSITLSSSSTISLKPKQAIHSSFKTVLVVLIAVLQLDFVSNVMGRFATIVTKVTRE